MDQLNDSLSNDSNTIPIQTDLNDAYDWADTLHLMPESIEGNEIYSEPIDSTKKQIVNTQDFSSSDLELFVDSMETIGRLEKTKYERCRQLKVKQLQKLFAESKRMVSCWDSSMIFISYDEEDTATETSCYVEEKPIYSLPYNASLVNTNQLPFAISKTSESEEPLALGQNSDYETHAKKHQHLVPNTHLLESEEYGIYFNNSDVFHVYEEIDAVRSYCKVARHPESQPFKSYQLRPATSATTNKQLSSISFSEEAEYSNIYERVFNDVSQLTKKSRTAKKHSRQMKKKRAFSGSNQKFLDKAMRFLSL